MTDSKEVHVHVHPAATATTSKEAPKDEHTKGAVQPLVAPAPGTAILATATIDSLFTLVYGTRSADIAATPTYSWATGNMIIAQWPAQSPQNYSAIFCTFNPRAVNPTTISQ